MSQELRKFTREYMRDLAVREIPYDDMAGNVEDEIDHAKRTLLIRGMEIIMEELEKELQSPITKLKPEKSSQEVTVHEHELAREIFVARFIGKKSMEIFHERFANDSFDAAHEFFKVAKTK